LGLGGRGWALQSRKNVDSASETVYLSPDLGAALGLSAGSRSSEVGSQSIELQSHFTDTVDYIDGKPAGLPKPAEQLVRLAPDKPGVRTLKVAYGGQVSADATSSRKNPTGLIVRLDTLFPSAQPTWTSAQRLAQTWPSQIYVRLKPSTDATARQACKAALETQLQEWNEKLPDTKWRLEMQL
jgi:hypothetical protein